jgi:hypothetical protein
LHNTIQKEKIHEEINLEEKSDEEDNLNEFIKDASNGLSYDKM